MVFLVKLKHTEERRELLGIPFFFCFVCRTQMQHLEWQRGQVSAYLKESTRIFLMATVRFGRKEIPIGCLKIRVVEVCHLFTCMSYQPRF